MARASVPAMCFPALFFGLFLHAHELLAQEAQAPPPPPGPRAQDLPEEDESLKPKQYSLNPVQAEKEISAGNFYLKKGNFRAAASRFKEASQWDPGNAEAFVKLGDASEHMHDFAAAREAYTKYLEMAKDSKDADAIRKRMAKWPKAYAEQKK